MAIVNARRYLKQVDALWDDADLSQRRELLHAILETVKVDVLAHRVICVEPKREFLALFRQIQELEEKDDGCFYIKQEIAAGC